MTDRLPSCTAYEVDAALRRGGFVPSHQRGSQRFYASPVTKKIVTAVPMVSGDLAHSPLEQIVRDAGLMEDGFGALL
jgi:predicted RNA binding protein YcfA (HicA-like mRNA interferase family)